MKLGGYASVIVTCFKQQMEYRLNFISGTTIPLLNIAVLWFVWAAIFASTPETAIGGYTFAAMITYTSIAVLIRSYVWINTEYNIETEVKSGSVASLLIKPISYPLYNFARDSGETLMWLITKLPFVVFAFLYLGITGPTSPLFFVSAFLGYLVNYFLVLLTGFWAFWTTGNIWGLRLSRQMIMEVVSGAIMPLTLFPLWLQNVFNVLPFQAVFYAPLSIYLGVVSGPAILGVLAVQLGWIGMLFAATFFAWRHTVRHVVVQGG